MVIREDDGKTGDESVFFLFIVGGTEGVWLGRGWPAVTARVRVFNLFY